ncbi:MAG: hypothetical protein IKM37_05070 [Alistipes sp.]|nr:hypothetical protein [Alistipes sp.]
MDEKPQFTSVNEDFSAEADAKGANNNLPQSDKKRIARAILKLLDG